jgi:membrane protein implicated in regulation of membrane protease activity
MPTPIVEVFDPIILISIGIIFVALEALFFSFFVFWFGIAAIIVGMISYVVRFDNGLWQIASVAVLAVISLAVLRAKALDRFMKVAGKSPNDDFLNTSGTGVIKDNKVYFKATYWTIDSHEKFIEDESVHVVSTKGATAVVQKLQR